MNADFHYYLKGVSTKCCRNCEVTRTSSSTRVFSVPNEEYLQDDKEERRKEEERYSRERECYGRDMAVKSIRQV